LRGAAPYDARQDLSIVAIIPARYGATRLPGKPLSDIHGKPLIQWVHERASAARRIDRVIVATDDERIAAAVRGFGGEAELTSPACASGTDRVAEVARRLDADVIVDVQGDEPMLDPEGLDALVVPFSSDPDLEVATLAAPLRTGERESPSVVKVVCDAGGRALYFSRSPIPSRTPEQREIGLRHIGVYAFRRAALLRFASLPVAPLEEAERLEQLRALHHGIDIRVVVREAGPDVAVDTPEDLERVRQLLAEAGAVSGGG